MRKIIHIDMDCFFAAVEQRDNPELRGKPVIVGGSPNSRGVVSTASYEARKFGVKSAMSSSMAYRLCPQGIFVYPRFEAYKEASIITRRIFAEYTDLIEPMSLDEAYLDVTQNKKGITSAIQIAKEIKQKIYEHTQLTASAGVSINKFVAKVASDMNKPNGLTFIAPEDIERFMEELPVEKFFGVGRVTAEKMHKLGIRNGLDIKQMEHELLLEIFGKAGHFYYQIVRGIDNRPVETERAHKSIGAENTFEHDIRDIHELMKCLEPIAAQVFKRMTKYELFGRTLTLKVKFSNFKQITRSKTVNHQIQHELELLRLAQALLLELKDIQAIRLLGISMSGFEEQSPSSAQQQLKIDF